MVFTKKCTSKLIPYFEYISEIPDELMRQLEKTIDRGYNDIKLDKKANGRNITKILNTIAEGFIADNRMPKSFADEHELAVTIGALFGYAVCMQYNWKWAMLGKSKEAATVSIVSPGNSYCIMPLNYAYKVLNGEKSGFYGEYDNSMYLMFCALRDIDSKPSGKLFTLLQ